MTPESNSGPNPPPETVEASAAAWLSLRDRGMSPEETAEFMRWLQQDPQHAAVFAELDDVWTDFDRLSALPAAGAAVDADTLAPRMRTRRPRWPAWAVAAAAVVTLAAWFAALPDHTAETMVGAFHKLDLPDGSVAQLNTNSAIDVAYDSNERRVRLVRGEVYFSVTKDAARPFVVLAESVEVRAVGTAFNVRQRTAAVEVLVTEGRVQLVDAGRGRSLLAPVAPAGNSVSEPALLHAGERATVPLASTEPQPATMEKVSTAAVQRALAWQERRLEFDTVPLAEVVAEFNRYNGVQLTIADERLAVRRFSGTFRADGYESLVRLLEENFDVTAQRSDREIILRVAR